MALKTNYTDEALDTTKNRNKKYQVTDNSDGTKSFVDVSVYLTDGDTFGASDINATNSQVNANTNALNTLSFGQTSDGKWGYKVGASTEVIPFKSTGVYYLGEGTAFNLKKLFPNDYQNFTADNFIVQPVSIDVSTTGIHSESGEDPSWTQNPNRTIRTSGNISKTYSNGVLTCGLSASVRGLVVHMYSQNADAKTDTSVSKFKAYLVMGDIETV